MHESFTDSKTSNHKLRVESNLESASDSRIESNLEYSQGTRIIVHVVAETWLKELNESNFQIPNYTSAHCFRGGSGRGGGCAFFVHNSLNFDPNKDVLFKKDFNGSNFLVISIRKTGFKLFVCYRETKTRLSDYYEIYDEILRMKSEQTVILY